MSKLHIHHLIIKFRFTILSIILSITVFMGYRASKIELDYQMAQLLPQTDSAVIAYNNFKVLFGEDANLIVMGIKDSSILQLEQFNALYDLSNQLGEITVVKNGVEEKGAKSVFSLSKSFELTKKDSTKTLSVTKLFQTKPTSQEELDSILSKIHNISLYNDLLLKRTDSSLVTTIAVTLKNEFVNDKARIEFVHKLSAIGQDFTEKTGITIHYSGLPYIRTHLMAKVKSELSLFIGLAALVLAIILYIFFRSFKAVFTALIIVGISVIWVFGTMSLLGYEITILTGLIPPLIIVIGIPNSIFLLNKYHQECTKHGKKEKALERVIKKIGGVIFLTNLTTASGFATFIFTSTSILVQFGTVAALNIMGLFLISITVYPIILSFQKVPLPKHMQHLENQHLNNAIKWLVVQVLYHRKGIYISTVALVLFSIGGITLIKTSGNVVDDIPKHDIIYQDLLFFEQQYVGVLPFEIAIDTKEPNGVFKNSASTLYKMKKLENVLTRDSLYTPYFSKPTSVLDGIKYMYQVHRGGDPKYNILPPPMQLGQLKEYYSANSTQIGSSQNSYLDSTKQIARMSLKMANVNTTQIQVIEDSLRKQVDEIFEPSDYNVSFTGTSVVFLKGTNFLVNNLYVSLALAIGLIIALITFMFGSFRTTIIALIPNIIPLLFTAGIMGYFGISIKPSTILVFSIAFGISVDDSIHFLAKYRQELKIYNGRIKFSVIEALKESGISMIYTSIVLFFGFSIFAASSFGGTIALGVLISLTLLVAMLTNIVLLPALLLSLAKAKAKPSRRKRKKV